MNLNDAKKILKNNNYNIIKEEWFPETINEIGPEHEDMLNAATWAFNELCPTLDAENLAYNFLKNYKNCKWLIDDINKQRIDKTKTLNYYKYKTDVYPDNNLKNYFLRLFKNIIQNAIYYPKNKEYPLR